MYLHVCVNYCADAISYWQILILYDIRNYKRQDKNGEGVRCGTHLLLQTHQKKLHVEQFAKSI